MSGHADGPKSAWVAVESEFQKGAATIKPAKSAYVYFQQDKGAEIRKQLKDGGEDADFAAMQREISRRWKELDDSAKAKYLKLAATDKARLNRENEERDAAAQQEAEERRKKREDVSEGGRERKVQEAKVERKVVRRELTGAEKKAKAAARKERDEKLGNIEDQQEALKLDKANAAEARLKFLLGQADIFQHFGVKAADKKSDAPGRSVYSLDSPNTPAHSLNHSSNNQTHPPNPSPNKPPWRCLYEYDSFSYNSHFSLSLCFQPHGEESERRLLHPIQTRAGRWQSQ
jgi:hypothetical protein